MITRNKVQNLYYIDRDTDIHAIIRQVQRDVERELEPLLEQKKIELQEKEAGEYFTIKSTFDVINNALQKIFAFFRGPVIEYYARQKYDDYSNKLDRAVITDVTDDIKRATGFVLYDSKGRQTDQVNSLLSFAQAKDVAEWLEDVRAVCFDDQGYIFPDSDHFNNLVKLKGEDFAKRQVITELKTRVENKFKK